MREQLRRDLTAAMKARDAVAVAALRSALAALENAEAVDVTGPAARQDASEHIAGGVVGLGAGEARRRVLTDAETTALVAREVDERRAAAAEYRALGRSPEADRLLREAAVLQEYLTDAE